MVSNKNINPLVAEIIIRGRKLYISLVFITQSYFKGLEDVKLNSPH